MVLVTDQRGRGLIALTLPHGPVPGDLKVTHYRMSGPTAMPEIAASRLVEDAAARAQQIAANSNARIKGILDARMGVMQINPPHSTDVSGSGNNDTTSLDKEIMAVVSAKFELD